MKTEINIYVVLAILFFHWVFDFVLQTDKQARGKSKNWNDLLSHTITYSSCWAIPVIFMFGNGHDTTWYVLHSLAFVGITFVAHTITDYYTSRLNSGLLPKRVPHDTQPEFFKEVGGNVHYFFVSIGFDQYLHFVQLILTLQLLS